MSEARYQVESGNDFYRVEIIAALCEGAAQNDSERHHVNELALRVFIVDDEPPARNRLRDVLKDCSEQLPLKIVGEAGNGQEALDKLDGTPVDVVLLDIRMPQMDGIELAQHLQKMPRPDLSLSKWPPVIIFTTAYDDYAIKAFELHAVDYLLKPIRLGRLFEALTRARECGSAAEPKHCGNCRPSRARIFPSMNAARYT